MDDNNPDIILVNEKNEITGSAQKLLVHQQGLLHRAFSVFIYRISNNILEILLQQRHPEKYHSGGLWTNTCCSHPRPGEDIRKAALRRLQEETGIMADLTEIGCFHYCADVGNDLIENEIDHVFIGEMPAHTKIHIDPSEITACQWISIPQLKQQLSNTPEHYTAWLSGALKILCENLRLGEAKIPIFRFMQQSP